MDLPRRNWAWRLPFATAWAGSMDMEGGMDIILSTAELSKQSYSTVLVAKLRRYDKTTPWIKGG